MAMHKDRPIFDTRWTPPRRVSPDETKNGPIRIMDAVGRTKRILKPDYSGLPCRDHGVRGCHDCSPRTDSYLTAKEWRNDET